MTEVIGVRFRGGCKEYYFDPHGITVEPNQFVIVETAQGLEYAQCVSGNHEVEDDSVVQPLRPLVRVATENDDRTYAYNKTREKNAFEVCQKKIAERGLDMKLVRVESNFDGSKIIFFFTSDGRVDFRELVRDLAGVFRARIELRQIGVSVPERDLRIARSLASRLTKAKLLGTIDLLQDYRNKCTYNVGVGPTLGGFAVELEETL